MDKTILFAMLRQRDSGLFGTSLSHGQVEGVEAIVDEGQRRALPIMHLAYVLATAYHETGGKMQPIRENLNYSVSGLLKTFGRHRISKAEAERYGRKPGQPADQKAIANIIYGGEWGRVNLGNTFPGDGWKFRGGGLPQLTGRANFEKFGIANNPDAIGEMKTAVKVMFDGMIEGLFTGKKLSDFTSYKPMRAIINGTDRASDVAMYAINFEKALHAAGYEPATAPSQEAQERPEPVPAPEPAPNPPSQPRGKSGRNTAIGGVIAVVLMALAGWWEWILEMVRWPWW